MPFFLSIYDLWYQICHNYPKLERREILGISDSNLFLFVDYVWLEFYIRHNFTLKHRRESIALYIRAKLCGTYQYRPCAIGLLPKELTRGSLTIRTTPIYLNNNSATDFTEVVFEKTFLEILTYKVYYLRTVPIFCLYILKSCLWCAPIIIFWCKLN